MEYGFSVLYERRKTASQTAATAIVLTPTLINERTVNERAVPGGRCVIMITDGDNMIRTQISLDEREYTLAKKEAKALGLSVAEFVRRAIRSTLPPSGKAPWMRYAGMVETGDPRSSQSIDEIVYGRKD